MINDIRELNFPGYATLSHAECNMQDMAEGTITTQVRIDGQVAPDFSSDWALEFQKAKYIMPLRQPQAAKENTSLDSTIDLTFQHWAVYQLKRWYFFTVQPAESGTAVPDQYIASVSLNLKDFCNLFRQVLYYYYGGTITIDLNPAWQHSQEPTTIEISHSYVWDVLIKLYDLYAVRWQIEPNGDIDHYVIKVGYPTKEIGHIFQYGFEGGLLKVERQVQDENIRNMIIGRGGDRNLPHRYFKRQDDSNASFAPDPDWIPELADIHFSELRGATFRSYIQGWKTKHYGGASVTAADAAYAPWAWQKGYTDTKFDPVEYVTDEIVSDAESGGRRVVISPTYAPPVRGGSSMDKYGPLQGGLENDDDIYPTIQGVTVDGLGRIDEAVAVEPITSDDIEQGAESDANISPIKDCKVTIDTDIPGDGRVTRVRTSTGIFTVPKGMAANLDEGPISVKLTKDYGVALQFLTTELKSEYLEVEDVRVTAVNVATGAEHSASGIPEGDYRLRVSLDLHNLKGYTVHATVSYETPTLTSATPDGKWANTWSIWVKDIWGSTRKAGETDVQYAERVWAPILGDRTGTEAKVVFSDGWLSTSEDYEFAITETPAYDTGKSLNGVPSHWRITLAKSDADLEATGLYLPSTMRQAEAGDHFFFVGTDMPHMYVVKAEERLDDSKKDALLKVKDIKPAWVVSLDKIRISQRDIIAPDTAHVILEQLGLLRLESGGALKLEPTGLRIIDLLRPGSTLTLFDKRFIPGSHQEKLYIQSVTYTYNEPTDTEANLLPDVGIVLSDRYETTASPVTTLQGEVEAISRQLGSISNIEQIVRAVGDRLYLRKDGLPDRSMSPTEYASLLTSLGFRNGIVGGAGWGFFKDSNGNWVLETDRINVRQEMQINSLVTNQIEGRGGMIIESAAIMEITGVIGTADGYVCYFDQRDGTVANLFHLDDVAYCNRFTPENGELKFYKRRVIAVDTDSVTLTKGYTPDASQDTGVNGGGIPTAGDVIVHYGNYSDKERQFVTVRDVIGGGYERYIEGLDSVNAAGREYYFVGRLAGMYNGRPRWYIGDKNGYIEWVNGELNIKGRINTLSTIGGKTVDQYVNDAAKSAADKAKAELQADIDALQRQVDGVIEAFSGYGAPTPSNYPADGWATDEERRRHDRDIYTDITPYVDNATTPTSGQSWKWYYSSPTDYGWVKIADSEAVKALQLAQMSVRDTDVLYISHTSQTSAPVLPSVNADGVITDLKGWSTTAPAWDATRYIWQTTYVRKGNGDASFSDPTCISGYNGKGITATTEYYAVNNDPANAPADNEFTTTVPQTSETKRYLWNYEKTTYSDNTYKSTSKRVIGTQGANGVDGAGIVSITNYYLASSLDTGITTSTDGWTTDANAAGAITTDEKPYLWNYEVVRYTKGNPTTTQPHIIGKNGVGVKSITEQYYLSTSRTELQDGSWSDTRPAWVAGRFYWTRSKIVYTDGTVEYTGELCATGEQAPNLVAQYSVDGSSWHPDYRSGDIYMRTSNDGGRTWSAASRFRGEDGQDGKWRKFQWAKNYSTTTAPTSGWQDTPLNANAGEYVWMRSGLVVPPATNPATWEAATRLTGDKGADGQSTYMLDLSNEVAGIPCNAAGAVTGSYPTSQASVYNGGTRVTSGITYSIAGREGISSASVSSSGLVTFSGLTTDSATITVQAEVAGLTLQSTINVYKVKPGADGEDGIQGPPGADGKTSYFHIKYSAVANPTSYSQMTETPSTYIGTYVDYTAADSTDPSRYTWARFEGMQGPKGDQGIPGVDGDTGLTSYLHIKYSNNGGTTFTPASGDLAIGETPGDWIGQYTDFEQTDSTDVSRYTWSKVKGDAAVVYSVQPSVNNVTRHADGSLSASSVTCTVYKTTGAATPVTSNEYTLSYQRMPDGTSGTLPRTNGVSAGVAILGNTEAVIFELKNGSTVLDRERVPVLSDVEDFSAGGENMVLNAGFTSRDFINDAFPIDATMKSSVGGVNVLKMEMEGAASDQWAGVWQGYPTNPHMVCLPDTYYSYSMMVYSPDISTFDYGAKWEMNVKRQDNSVTKWYSVDIIPSRSGEWQLITGRFKTPSDAHHLDCQWWITRNGKLWVAKPQLVRGATLPDWAPSPYDFNYLAEALKQSGSSEGGLTLTSLIEVGYTDSAGERVTTAGMNGITHANDDIAIWAGGDMVDAGKIDEGGAATVFRHDGTGYMAHNVIRFLLDKMMVGNDVMLDKTGLKLLRDGGVALEISNSAIATDFDKLAGSPTSFYFSLDRPLIRIIDGFTEIMIPGASHTHQLGELPAGSRGSVHISFNARQRFLYGDPIDGVYPWRSNVFVRVLLNGTQVAVTRLRQNIVTTYDDPVDHSAGYHNYNINETVSLDFETAGSYAVEVSVPGTAAYDTAVPANPWAMWSFSVSGEVKESLGNQTSIGNNGMSSLWGDTALAVNKDRAIFRAGQYGLSVDSTLGIRATIDSGKSWFTLKANGNQLIFTK